MDEKEAPAADAQSRQTMSIDLVHPSKVAEVGNIDVDLDYVAPRCVGCTLPSGFTRGAGKKKRGGQ